MAEGDEIMEGNSAASTMAPNSANRSAMADGISALHDQSNVTLFTGFASGKGSKEVNDDYGSVSIIGRRIFAALGDGMGGPPHGSIMSKVAVNSSIDAMRLYDSSDSGPGSDWISFVLSYANRETMHIKHLLGEFDSGTTLAIAREVSSASVSTAAIEISWVGDTIPYLVRRGGTVCCLGVPDRVESTKSTLSKAIGFNLADGSFHMVRIELARGDVLALLTDGIWESPWFNDRLLAELTRDEKPANAAFALVDACTRGNSWDDASALLIAAYDA